MAKVKHIVFGIDDRSLGQLIGLLANGGEVPEGSPDLIAAPGNPQAFTIDAAGYLRPVEFSRFINIQVQVERRRAQAVKGVQEASLSIKVADAVITADAEKAKKKDENPTAA
jgi:hypothetical protein